MNKVAYIDLTCQKETKCKQLKVIFPLGKNMKSKKITVLDEIKVNTNEKISFDKKLKIVYTLAKEDFEIIEKVKNKEFEPKKIFNLKLKAEEAAKQSEIKELISYPLIK